jgi:hypothetical protein
MVLPGFRFPQGRSKKQSVLFISEHEMQMKLLDEPEYCFINKRYELFYMPDFFSCMYFGKEAFNKIVCTCLFVFFSFLKQRASRFVLFSCNLKVKYFHVKKDINLHIANGKSFRVNYKIKVNTAQIVLVTQKKYDDKYCKISHSL